MKKLLQKLIWILLNSMIIDFCLIDFFYHHVIRFVHLANIRMECAKLRQRLDESKREVLSRRSSNEQTQLLSVLDAMIAVSSRTSNNTEFALITNISLE